MAQDWDLFCHDCPGFLQFQRSVESFVFGTDGEAMAFVMAMAERADPTSRVALNLDASFQPMNQLEQVDPASPTL